jgi:hypothetical protein
MTAIHRSVIVVLGGLALARSALGVTVYTYGAGTKTCGAWVEKRKEDDHFAMAQWMLGYVSAAGYYGDFRLRESEGQALVVWMDNYCQQNPLETFEKGVQKLIDSLRKEGSRKKP